MAYTGKCDLPVVILLGELDRHGGRRAEAGAVGATEASPFLSAGRSCQGEENEGNQRTPETHEELSRKDKTKHDIYGLTPSFLREKWGQAHPSFQFKITFPHCPDRITSNPC